jgi:predicted Zn-dependent protease
MKPIARPRPRRLAAAVLAACLVAVVPACSTAPVTGRHQFIAFSENTEIEMGVESYKQFLGTAPVSTNKTTNDMVRRVGMRIAAATEKAGDYQWEFTVVKDDKTVNAFCLPGGKVVVYTGILPVTQDEAGLAVVMGHEIAHATARHGGERLTTSTAVQILLKGGETGLSIALQNKSPEIVTAVNQAFGLGAQVGVELPFSRKQEAEADQIGLIYMARAGYDPAQSVEFWKRMSQLSEGGTPQFLSTHPSHETRVSNLEKWIPDAMKEYDKSSNKGK